MSVSDEGLGKICERWGLKLPPPPKPVGAYRLLVPSDRLVFLSGQISKNAEGQVATGTLGLNLSVEEGKQAARCAVLQAVSLIRSEMELDKVDQILRVVGYVQSSPDFHSQSDVMNGASELLVEIFVEIGSHARSAVGVASLPLNAAVELELTLKIHFADRSPNGSLSKGA